MPKTIDIKIVSAYDSKGSQAAAKALADLVKAGAKGAGLSAAAAKDAQALSRVATAAAQAGQAQAKLATETQKTAAASNQAAVSAQRLATEQQRTAASASNVVAAQARAEKAALSLAQAQNKAAESGSYFQKIGAGVTSSLMSVIGPVAVASAGFAVAESAVRSFADAFQFKAQLDATTLAVNAQLQGIRDSGQVWNEASAFAQKFKLTQQETTQAVAASIGVMRSSKAPVEDILGVLARMQVLSPEQSLEEAAIALKSLAAGDTTSLVTRFEVGRDVANQMKAEIQGGADAVQVMSKFLGDTGIGMDVLAAKTTGAAGAIKDLAIAQEELKLAQAAFAQGPGLAILQTQIEATTGATRVLSGDFDSMQNSIVQAASEGGVAFSVLDTLMGGTLTKIAAFGAVTKDATAAQAEAAAQAAASAAGTAAYTAELERSGSVGRANAAYEAAHAASLQASTTATQDQSSATNIGTTAFGAYQQAAVAATQGQMQLAVATAASAMQSQVDAAAKEEEAAKTALLTAQTSAAVSAFMALHPGITASGVASLAAAGQITPLLAQLIQATLRAREAASALAQFNALQGVKAARVAPNEDRSAVEGMKRERVEADRTARGRVASAQYAAEKERTLAVGTTAQKTALLQNEYNAAVTMYGAGSVQAYQAQTKILQATEKGSAARGASAGAAATKLEGIETNTGAKLSQIVQDTQAKLIEIDRKAAEERAKIASDLANKIATSSADRRASNEADDLDLIGVTDKGQADKLNDREQAQAASREREIAAAKEAQDAIANGEAESAAKVYDIREKQIGDQEQLDEKYAERQRELAGNKDALSALKTQYDEGTKANEAAAQTRIDIAKAEAQAKDQAVIDEKAAVLQAANDQANDVIGAAERSATGVKTASADAKKVAVENLKAIGDAVTAIPAAKTITITVSQTGTVGAASAGGDGGGGNKAAGGGNFMTSGPTTLRVGDNPGGRELVTVTPLSGEGTSRASGNLIAMAGGGVLDAGGGYTTPVAGAPVASSGKGGKGGKKTPAAQSIKDALAEQKEMIALLSDMIQLRHDLDEELRNGQPFNVEAVEWLAKRAAQFTQLVRGTLVPTTKAQGEALKLYTTAAKDSISVLSDVGQLRHDLQDAASEQPFSMDVIGGLVFRASQFVQLIRQSLVPTTEREADAVERYADAVSSTVGILSDVAGLRHDLQDAASEQPFDMAVMQQLADAAMQVVGIVSERLIPTAEAQSEALGTYADIVGGSVSILSDVLSLGKNLAEGGAALITDAVITQLADQAVRIATIVQSRLIPTTEAQSEALGTYADLVGSSVSALSDVAGLSGKLLSDYVSPTDAEIGLLATDAQRITQAFFDAGQILGKDGAEAGKMYAEGVGAAFSAAKEGLLVIDALKSGDFVLPAGALNQFEASSMDVLATMQALGGRAAAIPAADIARLGAVTSAISGQAEALIKLAAVPFGDLAGAAGGLAQAGGAMGGGGSTTIYNTFNLPQGSNQQTAQEVIRLLSQHVGMRH